jgi:hypothetical protein
MATRTRRPNFKFSAAAAAVAASRPARSGASDSEQTTSTRSIAGRLQARARKLCRSASLISGSPGATLFNFPLRTHFSS